jgi:hypothetical protein
MGEYHLRRAEPGTKFTVTLAGGEQHDFSADDDGVVAPKSPEEDAALQAMGLPVARKAESEAKADEPAADEEPVKTVQGGKG